MKRQAEFRQRKHIRQRQQLRRRKVRAHVRQNLIRDGLLHFRARFVRVGEQVIKGDFLPRAQVDIDRRPFLRRAFRFQRPAGENRDAQHIIRQRR